MRTRQSCQDARRRAAQWPDSRDPFEESVAHPPAREDMIDWAGLGQAQRTGHGRDITQARVAPSTIDPDTFDWPVTMTALNGSGRRCCLITDARNSAISCSFNMGDRLW